MAHSREIRPYASEVKFVVPAAVASLVQAWARTHLDPDPHGSGPFGDEYQTTSVYLDTADCDVFHRRGSFGRSKYRIRRYGHDGFVFLERKMRQPAVLAKRRTRIALASLALLQQAGVDDPWPGQWFHRRIVVRRLQPVCQVGYFRMARVTVRDGEQVRLTLDSGLAAHAASDLSFAGGMALPVLSGHAILELKYRGAPPAIFRRLVEEFALNPQVASKYRLGMTALQGLDARIGGTTISSAQAFYA
jgi:VTC domain